MGYVSWSDDVRVGNSFIDSDQQKLTELLNRFKQLALAMQKAQA